MGTRRAGMHIRNYTDTINEEFIMAVLNVIKDYNDERERRLAELWFSPEQIKEYEKTVFKAHPYEEKPVVICGEKFISFYWYDVIRTELIQELAELLTKKYEVPVLGASWFDGDVVSLAARCVMKNGRMKKADGEYFDYELGEAPISCIKLCDILDTPELVGPFREALEAQDSEEMVELVGKKTDIYIDGYDAAGNGDRIEKIEEIDHVEIYRLKRS